MAIQTVTCDDRAAWAPIQFLFNERKAAEAATVLLQEAGGRMPYLRLIKLLYLADRENLHRYGRPIVGGRYVAMKYGPVLSEVLDRIKQKDPIGSLQDALERHGYDVRIRGEAQPPSVLSEAEVQVLRETSSLYRQLDRWALCDLTHLLPEWRDPGDSCFEIRPEDILKALGKPDEETEDIRDQALEDAYFTRLFSSDAH